MSKQWHALTAEEVCAYWEVDPQQGLDAAAVAERYRHFGPNRLAERPRPHPLVGLLDQFRDAVVLILLAAAVASIALGEVVDAITIGAIVVLNAVLGFVHQYRAERALEALRALTAPAARVVRGGQLRTVPAEELVPGDIIELEDGDRVPADARLLEAAVLEVEESALTGESVPVAKDAQAAVPRHAGLGDRINMLYQGTVIARGRARAVVVGTGMQTEVGRVAGLMQSVEEGETPLQRRLGELGRWLVVGCGCICALVVVAGLYTGQPPYVMFLAGISLAVAAIPEGLPAVVTILLALGVQRMARKQAVVRRLPAVETLGCTTVICSDKTGTLTQNRMELREVWLGGEPAPTPLTARAGDGRLERLLTSLALCTNTRGDQGSPTELGLVRGVQACGVDVERLRRRYPRLREVPFDSRSKRMTVACRTLTGWQGHTKGAPEVIIPRASTWWDGRRRRPLSERDRRRWLEVADAMAARALRVLAVAERQPRPGEDPRQLDPDRLDSDLTLLGLVGLMDP
ncbi:MAG TPA: HAD-IC family P-type ATPase, partial [Bacillota bacterium]